MNVSLTPELEKLISEKVASGMYQTASEVVREGLRLLAQRDAAREEKLKDLRTKVQVGLEQLARGGVIPAERVTMERIRERGSARLVAAKKR